LLSTLRIDRTTRGKETRYRMYRRLGGPRGRSGRVGFEAPDLPSTSKPLNRVNYTELPSINTHSKMKAAERAFINLPLEIFAKIRRIVLIFVQIGQ
jgi:hypothetical protein